MKAESQNPVFARPVFQEKRVNDGYPQIRDSYAIAYVAMTTLILAYAGMFGAAPILLFYAIWLQHVYYKGRFTLRLTKDIYPAIALAAICVVSVLWSDVRDVTAKAAIESFSMVACSIIVARVTTLKSFIKGIALGASLVLVASLIDGSYGTDYFTGTYSLIGLFSSKNQVGLFAEIGIFAAMLFLFSKNNPIQKILFSLFPLAICTLSLYLSRSASSEITLFLTFAVCGGAYILTKFPKNLRKSALIGGIFLTTIVVIAGLSLGWQQMGLSAFGKDTTLTGRTYLWMEGLKFGIQNPLLGVGYGDFWVPGRPLAERLWFKFDIFGRTGFHFHNTFIQTFVDLGIIGLFAISLLFVISCIRSLQYVIENGMDLLAYYAVGVSFMFFIRSFVEIDIGGTFGIGPLIFFSVLPRLHIHQLTQKNSGVLPKKSRLPVRSRSPARGGQ